MRNENDYSDNDVCRISTNPEEVRTEKLAENKLCVTIRDVCGISTNPIGVKNEKRPKHKWCVPRLVEKEQSAKIKNQEALFAPSKSNNPIDTKSVIKFVRKENEISDQGVPSERQLENENAVLDQGEPRECQLEVDKRN